MNLLIPQMSAAGECGKVTFPSGQCVRYVHVRDDSLWRKGLRPIFLPIDRVSLERNSRPGRHAFVLTTSAELIDAVTRLA